MGAKLLQARAASLLKEHAMTINRFRSPNMPWEGSACRSPAAGLSGACYALPALVASGVLEPALWLTTAFLSCMADYVHISHDSAFHGLDRCWATLMLLRCSILFGARLDPSFFLLALVPLGCFVKGRDAKLLPDPSGWVFWHTLWHCSGGLVVTLGVWMLYRVPAEAVASGLHIG